MDINFIYTLYSTPETVLKEAFRALESQKTLFHTLQKQDILCRPLQGYSIPMPARAPLIRSPNIMLAAVETRT